MRRTLAIHRIAAFALFPALSCTSNANQGAVQRGAPVAGPVIAAPSSGATVVGSGGTGSALGTGGASAPAIGTGGGPVTGGGAQGGAGGAPMMLGQGGAAGGAAGMAGAAGSSSGMPSKADLSSCAQPPAGASTESVQAWMTLDTVRLAAGSSCINLVPALNKSALSHCSYNAANASNSTCVADAHGEVSTCTGFTGADVAAREKAAGYSAQGATEVLTSFGNMPVLAVPSWIDTVWHRIPMLDPWTTDMGYGGAAGCDVIDFGAGTKGAPTDAIVVYPYDGQTGVPPSFSGLEGPQPPAPPSGWPSGYPVNVYAQGLSVTDHVLTKDGDSTPIAHVWMDANSSNVDPGYRYYLLDSAFMYANTALAPNTKYRAKITGTHTGGALSREWTFTTGAAVPVFGH